MKMTKGMFDNIPMKKEWNDIFVPTLEDCLVRVKCKNIAWIGVEDGETVFHFVSGETLIVSTGINMLNQKLPPDTFVRISHSEIVNVLLVDTIIGNTLKMGNHEFVVDKEYREPVFACFYAIR